MQSARLNLCRFVTLIFAASASVAVAGDKTWDNGSTNSTWDVTSVNWSGSAWNNAAGDGAIFGATGAGTISVPGGISVNSINFSVLTLNSYTLNGTGPLTFVNGASTQTTGVINVASSATATINVPITSSVTPIQKIGGGILSVSAPVTSTVAFPDTANGSLTSNILIGPAPYGQSPGVGGTLRILNTGVLSSTSNVALGYGGILDIGANNVTIGTLNFLNQNSGLAYGTSGGQFGVIGSGTLKVTGEINVIGDNVLQINGANAIDSNLDLGGGTQIIRVGSGGSFLGPYCLMFTGTVSNGSLLKTLGYNQNGVPVTASDGIALLGNNTYTGPTLINLGTNGGGNVATGTNASTSLKVVNGIMTLQGANGSYGAATAIQVSGGGTLVLDNNAAFGTGFNAGAGPPIAAANNNDRIADTAVITMRDGSLTYRGLSNNASSETYGSMNITGGFNTITIAPTGTGTASFNAAGNLSLDSRAALQISATSTVLASTGLVRFGGTVPAGVGPNLIIPRIVSTSDFVTYDPTNGFKPLPAGSYSSTLTAGTDVALSGATAVPSSVAVNAIKTTATLTTTIASSAVLGVTGTGMVFAASGTHTITGNGTLDFGSTPGTFIGTAIIGTTGNSTAVTGSQGLLATGTLTLSAFSNLAGLTGTISNIGIGSLTLSTNTLPSADPIEVRRGTLSITSLTTLSGTGAITLGVSANDSNLLPANPTLSISSATANNLTISRPIIVDNGATNAGGMSLNRFSFLPLISPLSNTTGSQTFSGNITLNTSLNLQGGAANNGSTGATNFGDIISGGGNISGAGTFVLSNGRANFNGDISNTGGLLIAFGGFTAIANLQGTISNGVPIVMNGGTDSRTGFSYTTQANLGTSPITIQNAGQSSTTFNSAPSIFVLGNGSSITNSITLNGDVAANVGSGITATWAGPVTGPAGITKSGAGTLIMTNSSYTGSTIVSAGTLKVNGSAALPGTAGILVGTASGSTAILDVSGLSGGTSYTSELGGAFALTNGQALLGYGTVHGQTVVQAGATVAPGGSIGTLNFDSNLLFKGIYLAQTAATGAQLADDIVLSNGNLTIDPLATLQLPVGTGGNAYDNATPMTIMQVLNGGSLNGTFASVTGMPANYFLNYTSSSLVLAPVPEPGTMALAGAAVAAGLALRRRRRQSTK